MPTLSTPRDFGAGPAGKFKRWLLELKLAEKRDHDWKKEAGGYWEIYRGAKRRKNSFNILYSNTETLAPALYNSTPTPDVRRRFRDSDVLGKAVSEVLERSLAYSVDCEDFDDELNADIIDALVPGRGVSRIRYIPSFREVEQIEAEADSDTDDEGTSGQADDEQELEYEQVSIEHVNWEDFRHGPGRSWKEVQWVAFRHNLNREDCIEHFGEEEGNAIPLNAPSDDEVKKRENGDIEQVFSTVDVWEIWDKGSQEVFWIIPNYPSGILYDIENPDGTPPLEFRNFFPCPQPLILSQDSSSLVPVAPYEQYKEQAEELNRISTRINVLVNGMKLRGVYDSTLPEIADLMKGSDNDLIPVSDAEKWADRGGIEKAILWMPLDQAIQALQALMDAREKCLQTIYEITGISDIMRAASDPNETYGAQKIKSTWGTQRLQRMQRRVQAYVRDLIRLMGEVVAEKFQVPTFQKMTGLNFPTNEQKQQTQMQWQHMQAMAAMQSQLQPPPGPPQGPQGAPPQPQQPPQMPEQMQQMLAMPSWEDIDTALKDAPQREFRIDIETDSTVCSSLEGDMAGLEQVLGAVVQWIEKAAPAIQSGMLPMEAVKAITLTIVRRARMGMEVEDALQEMKAPNAPQDPNAGKMQVAMAELQQKQQLAVAEQQAQAQQDAQQQHLEAQREANKIQMEMAQRAQDAKLEQQTAMFQAQLAQQKESADRQLAIILAHIKNIGTIEAARISASADDGAAVLASQETKQ